MNMIYTTLCSLLWCLFYLIIKNRTNNSSIKKDRRLTNKHSKRCVKIIINAVVSRINSLKSIRVWFPLVYLILQILIVIIFYLCICNFKKNIIRSKFYKLQNIQDTFNMRIRISIIYHFEMLYSLQPILL